MVQKAKKEKRRRESGKGKRERNNAAQALLFQEQEAVIVSKDICDNCRYYKNNWCNLCGGDTTRGSRACYWFKPKPDKEKNDMHHEGYSKE